MDSMEAEKEKINVININNTIFIHLFHIIHSIHRKNTAPKSNIKNIKYFILKIKSKLQYSQKHKKFITFLVGNNF